MGKTIIKFDLSEKGIDGAIKSLDKYKSDVSYKTELLRKKVASYLADLAQQGFDNSIVDDIVDDPRKADVDVSVDDMGTYSVVIANGYDAVWVEFGAGVYHNGSAGSSPHPKGKELGFTIGDYGLGNGRRRIWGFYDVDGLHLTRGTKATMPMLNAVNTICDEIQQIAEEVFK